MSQEPLQFASEESWSDLQKAFLDDWPRGLPGYSVLETQRRWRALGFDYGFKVYCPFSDARNGFVALNEKASYYEIIIQYPNDNTVILETVLRATRLIDWKKRIILPFTGYHVISCMEKVVDDKNVEMKLLPSDTFVLEKNYALFEDVSLPPGFTFGPVFSKHVDLIDSNWPHRYPTSTWFFEKLVETNSGYGLYKDEELVSWIFIGECGNLTHLYTLEEHRRKGYAELVLKLISNVLLKEGKDVFAFCVKGNENACKLYQKVGFGKSVDVSWCYLSKI